MSLSRIAPSLQIPSRGMIGRLQFNARVSSTVIVQMGFGGTQRGFEKFDKVSKLHFEVTKKDRVFVFQISCFKLV